jgi:uncharacterized OB-fold protein
VCGCDDFAEEVKMLNQDIVKFPIPTITEIDQGFWEGVQKGILYLQKCLDCNQLQFFPRPLCVHCFSANLGWQESNGTGSVYSFTIVYIPLVPVVRKHVESTGIPNIFALIDLDEGIRMVSQIVGCKPEDVKLGARVKVSFEEAQGTNFKLPRFQLIKSEL